MIKKILYLAIIGLMIFTLIEGVIGRWTFNF